MSKDHVLSDDALEDRAEEVFQRLDLHCEANLNDVQLSDLNPEGSHSSDDHFEFDFLIPKGEFCLVVEITSRGQLSRKHKRFRKHLDIFRNCTFDDPTWSKLGVSKSDLSRYGDVKTLIGVFITNRFESRDVDLSDVTGVVNIYKSGWKLIETYAESIGKYGRYHFLSRLGVPLKAHKGSVDIFEDEHTLHRESHAKVASGEVPTASLFSFTVSPYEILPFAKVYRRDDFPGAESGDYKDYQRPLYTDKLSSMRKILRSHPDFMFPNNILCVLSDSTNYSDGTLSIPKKYGSISIIDGQHRLFSYASEKVESNVEDPRIMVTAIKFRNVGPEDEKENLINKFSAKTFVEINTEQTEVDSNHLDFIKFDVLDETSERALAAKVLLLLNERDNSVKGLFKTYQTALGVISPRMIISGLKIITNTSKVERLENKNNSRRKGYEEILDASISELTNPSIMITKAKIAFERYFNHLRTLFYPDWPQGRDTTYTSLAYTKVFHGFVRLMWYFINNGLDWEKTIRMLAQLKSNLHRLVSGYLKSPVIRRQVEPSFVANAIADGSYSVEPFGRIFAPSHDDIPTQRQNKGEIYDFFEANLQQPTSIQTIVRRRLLDKL